MSNELNATVVQRVEVSPGLIILRVVPNGWAIPSFTPGQFGVLALPGSAKRCVLCDAEEPLAKPDKLIKRAYSIASSSAGGEYLEFYIAHVPSGALTPRLFALQHGDGVWLSPKIKGMFTLADAPADKHLVLVATGTGLAPYMSMLRSEFMCGTERQFAVLHGARHSWELGYRSELRTLERLCPNFTYIPVVSRPEEEPVPWGGVTGYVQDLWACGVLSDRLGVDVTPQTTRIFLCGNPSMIESMVTTLEDGGFVEHTRKQDGEIFVERYW